jgi:hypothetical protein
LLDTGHDGVTIALPRLTSAALADAGRILAIVAELGRERAPADIMLWSRVRTLSYLKFSTDPEISDVQVITSIWNPSLSHATDQFRGHLVVASQRKPGGNGVPGD